MDELIAVWKKRAQTLWDVVVVPIGGLRTVLLAALAAWLLSVDPKAVKALSFGLGLVAAALTFLHWYRKSQHPYIDVQKAWDKALKTSTGAAIVLVGFFAFMAVVLIFILMVVIR